METMLQTGICPGALEQEIERIISIMDQEKNEELRSLGMDRLKKLLGESERLRKMSGKTENPPSNKQMREWVKILKETSQILEQELERRSTEEMKTER